MDGNEARMSGHTEGGPHDHEPQIYRCGWCGCPTNKDGENFAFESEKFNETTRIIKEHGDAFTTLVNGQCCPNGHG